MAMAKIDILHVPYRGIAAGGPSDLMTGVVHVAFDNLPSSIELIRSSKVRALAVTTTARSELLPDVPTVGDFLPGYEASAWYGVGAPNATSTEVVERLNTELNAALADPKTMARISEVGGTLLPGSPANFGRFIAKEVEKWGKVVELSGTKIKAE
jgi:tripartite-type tricarboxylate transporter receptor subunit TctC